MPPALVRVRYETENTEDRSRRRAPERLCAEEKRSGIAPPPPRGDADAAYAAAPHTISAEYWLEGEYHNPMELYGSTVIY